MRKHIEHLVKEEHRLHADNLDGSRSQAVKAIQIELISAGTSPTPRAPGIRRSIPDQAGSAGGRREVRTVKR